MIRFHERKNTLREDEVEDRFLAQGYKLVVPKFEGNEFEHLAYVIVYSTGAEDHNFWAKLDVAKNPMIVVQGARGNRDQLQRALVNVLQRAPKLKDTVDKYMLKDVLVDFTGTSPDLSLRVTFYKVLPNRGSTNNHDLNGKRY